MKRLKLWTSGGAEEKHERELLLPCHPMAVTGLWQAKGLHLKETECEVVDSIHLDQDWDR